ncbi:MAG: antitoxin VapB family protein [Nanoarchaeota archaeon]
MASINISLTEEAYNYLKMLKGNEKSFSEVVLEIKSDKKSERGTARSLLKYAGCLKNSNINWKNAEENMLNFRKSFNNRIEETRKKMESLR